MNKMYEELAERLNSQNSKYIPRLFEMIADEDEAALMLAMPATVPEQAEKTGFSTEKIEAMLKLLFQKGLVFYSKRTDPPTWRMCRSVGQFHDASILWPGATQAFMETMVGILRYGMDRHYGSRCQGIPHAPYAGHPHRYHR